jgi:hypothetical protein
VQARQLAKRQQVVTLGGTVHALTIGVERCHSAAQAYLVDQNRQQSRCVGPARQGLQPGDVAGELGDAGGVLLGRDPVGEADHTGDIALLADPFTNARMERPRRAAECLAEIGRRERRAARQSQPRHRSSYRRALEEVGSDATTDRDRSRRQGDLHRCQRGVDAGEHRNVARLAAGSDRALDRRQRGLHRIGIGRGRPARRPRGGGGRCPDRLVDPSAIVAKQAVGGLDDAGGAAIVDLERMVTGAREPAFEVDQPCRVGTVVAVDRLVVVADAEHGAARRREQPDQQQMRRGEVLELVDQ